MKTLIISLLTLFVAVVIALIAMEDPGYVLIAIDEWTVETTLALAAVLFVFSFFTLYYVIRAFRRVLAIPGGVRQWKKERREHKAMKSLTRGLIDLAEGHWVAAEKRVLKYVKDDDGALPRESSLLNYLAAARAAQAQGADQRRDHYLKLAHENHPSADIAVGLTQAELQLNQNQLEQALATLQHLHQLSPKHPKILQVLAIVYQQLGDWEHLLEITPLLRKHKAMPMDAILEYTQQAHLKLLQTATEFSVLADIWSRIPEGHRENEEVLSMYVTRLLQLGESNLAEPLLRHSLRKQFSESLLAFYGKVDCVEPNRQLDLVESLLVEHERNFIVLLTAGRLCLRNKLWGKARSYFEASINAHPSAEAYNELGNLLDRMGESAAAAECFRAGLGLVHGCEQSTPINMVLSANPAIALSNDAIMESEIVVRDAVAIASTSASSTKTVETEKEK